MQAMNILSVTSMRNEAPYLLEWIAYHKMIGISQFLVISNDCSDGTDAMLDRLSEIGLVRHLRNKNYEKKGVQWTALDLAAQDPWTKAAEWIFVHDCDEFLNIKLGDGHVSDLVNTHPEATGFALPWRLFGNGGVVTLDDQPTIAQFTRCAPEAFSAPWTASLVKTLFKNDGTFGKLGVHRPKKPQASLLDRAHWINGQGIRLPKAFVAQGMVLLGPYSGQSQACINHYSLRSAHGFFSKSQRGLPNVATKPIDLGYWIDRNFNGNTELSIQRNLPSLKDALADLKSDPILGSLHADGLAYHRSIAAKALDTRDGVIQLVRMLTQQSIPMPERLGQNLTETLRRLNQEAKGQ